MQHKVLTAPSYYHRLSQLLMRARKFVNNQNIRYFFAGSSKRLDDQPQLPTLRSFGYGFVALLMVCVGMVRMRMAISNGGMAGMWIDPIVLVGGGLIMWLWQFGRWDAARVPLIGHNTVFIPRWWLGGSLAIGAIAVAIWAWRRLVVEFPTDADWLWYVASVALLIIAAAVMEKWEFVRPSKRNLGRVAWALPAIVLLGAVARLLVLNSLPFGTWYDEAANGLESLRVAREPAYRPIYTDGVNATGHYLWLIVGAFKLFGENTFAVRSISATMGIATIVAAYFVGRELRGVTLGLVWALLVAVARWSITFSRLGMYNSATPLFELLALFWLLRGLRRGSVLDFTLSGVAIGLGLCFYSAFQLFLVVLGIFLLMVGWQERARWRTLAIGVGICVLATTLVVAPLAKFVLTRPDSYFARVQTTSLLADKAPEERLPALWENTRKHLLMFNVRGDPNGRHNLPGEPMLDWVSGGMLVVGLAMALRRGLAPRYLMIPIWIFVGLLGGILSLDFEAPQSLRAIGALPAVLLCAALPPTVLIDEWRRGAGRYYPQAGFLIVALVFLLPASVANFKTYFVDQARDFAAWNAHSTPETIAAKFLRDVDPTVEKYVISLFDGHPTVRFLASNVPYRRIETNATLPLLHEMPNGMMLILDTERRELYEEARRLYPNAAFEEIQPPYGGPTVVYVNKLTTQDLQSVQGLMGSYSSEAADQAPVVQKEMAFDFQWPDDAPIALPFVADWQGVLAVNTFGPYQFFVQAPANATLWIGESVVMEGDAGAAEGLGGGLMLARGNHTIRLQAEGGEGRVRLAWQPPDGPPTTVPAWALYVPPVRSNGLLGSYFANGEWSGEPAFAQIDPRLTLYFHVPTLPRPYTVEWKGKIAIPTSGHYDFALQSIDESYLWVEGQEIVASRVRNQMATGGLTLDTGLHDIVVRYADRTDHTFINLMWRPPGGDAAFRAIPSGLLFPPQENYDQIDVGDLARFTQSDAQLPTTVVRDEIDAAVVEVMASGLAQPRGVAVLDSLVYVAEAGKSRVVAFDASSGLEVASPFDALDLMEPFDLAVLADGSITVMDAGTGRLLRFEPEAGVIGTLTVAPSYVERSRGIGAGMSGDIWIANTPGQRVVAVDSAGAVLQEIVLPPVTGDDKELQPVDVAVMPDNTLFVTDVARHMLYRFSQAGYLISSQPIPTANALDSAHLATDAAGSLYMTEPESGRVVKLDGNGVVTRIWSVRSDDATDAKPVGIAVADDGAIWVADSQGGRLLRIMPVDEE